MKATAIFTATLCLMALTALLLVKLTERKTRTALNKKPETEVENTSVSSDSELFNASVTLEERLMVSSLESLEFSEYNLSRFVRQAGDQHDQSSGRSVDFVILNEFIDRHLESPEHRGKMVDQLLVALNDRAEHLTLRDYAAQHLVVHLAQFDASSTEIIDALLAAAEEGLGELSPLAGTILNALSGFPAAREKFSQTQSARLQSLSVSEIFNSAVDLSGRVSAVHSLDQDSFDRLRQQLAQMLGDRNTPEALAMALCHSFGKFGSESDLPILRKHAEMRRYSAHAADIASERLTTAQN